VIRVKLFNLGEDEKDAENDWCGWHNDHGTLTGLCSAMYFDKHGNGKRYGGMWSLTVLNRSRLQGPRIWSFCPKEIWWSQEGCYPQRLPRFPNWWICSNSFWWTSPSYSSCCLGNFSLYIEILKQQNREERNWLELDSAETLLLSLCNPIPLKLCLPQRISPRKMFMSEVRDFSRDE